MDMFGLSGVSFIAPWRLVLVPCAIILFSFFGFYARSRFLKDRNSLFVREFVRKGDLPPSVLRLAVCALAFIAALLFAVAYARPEFVHSVKTPVSGGARVAFIVDVSPSMEAEDADDGGRTLARVDAMRKYLNAVETTLAQDPTFGEGYARTLIPFAGHPLSYGNFTNSATQIREFFSWITTKGMINSQGSDLVKAAKEYGRVLDEYPLPQDTVDVAIVISDGGNDPGGVELDVAALAEEVARLAPRATIIAVGIGRDEPAKIPVRSPDGSRIGDFLKSDGTPWTSAFDESIMRSLTEKNERCIRLAPPLVASTEGSGDPKGARATTATVEVKNCIRAGSVDELAAMTVALIQAKRVVLPPKVEVKVAPAEHFFIVVGLVFLFLANMCERSYAIARRRQKDRPMRELFFDDTADQ